MASRPYSLGGTHEQSHQAHRLRGLAERIREERQVGHRAVDLCFVHDGRADGPRRRGGRLVLREPEPRGHELRLDRGLPGVQGRGGEALSQAREPKQDPPDERVHRREPERDARPHRAGRPCRRGVAHVHAAVRGATPAGGGGRLLGARGGSRLEA